MIYDFFNTRYGMYKKEKNISLKRNGLNLSLTRLYTILNTFLTIFEYIIFTVLDIDLKTSPINS